MSESRVKQQRQQVQQQLLDWIKAHANTPVTLDEMERELNAARSSISGAINNFISNNTLPGFERIGNGIYRYTPFSTNGSAAADDTPQRLTLVGRINRSVIIITDNEGNVWRAEKLK